MISKTWILIALVTPTALGCNELFTSEPEENELLDGPIGGLSPTQVATFIKGDEAFWEIYLPATGLGPYFVTSSCATCHPTNTLTRFGRMDNGVF